MLLTLPLSVVIPRKTKADKVWILNLNGYRNTHFITLNDAKRIWADMILNVALTDDKWTEKIGPPLRFTYTVFPATNRKFDTSNVCAVIDKFTCDALIEHGIIPDDSYKVIPVIIYKFGKVDRDNPRCELEIESICDPFTKEDERAGKDAGVCL